MLGGIARTSPATWHGLGLIVGYAGCKSGQRNCAQIHSLIVGVMVMLVLLLVVLTVGGGGCSGSEGTFSPPGQVRRVYIRDFGACMTSPALEIRGCFGDSWIQADM